MAEMPVRLGPPFGGITRIRFKGSPANLPDSQPRGSPAFNYVQNRTGSGEVNVHQPRPAIAATTQTDLCKRERRTFRIQHCGAPNRCSGAWVKRRIFQKGARRGERLYNQRPPICGRHARLYNLWLDRGAPVRDAAKDGRYGVAAGVAAVAPSCFALVWKIASQFFPSFFQTDPAL